MALGLCVAPPDLLAQPDGQKVPNTDLGAFYKTLEQHPSELGGSWKQQEERPRNHRQELRKTGTRAMRPRGQPGAPGTWSVADCPELRLVPWL